MSLEDLTGSNKYISDLDVTNPTGIDQKSFGDDHIRGIKNTIKNTFEFITGKITASHTELNYTKGVTSSIQAQIASLQGQITANTNALSGAAYVSTGDIMVRPTSSVPAGFYECNGSAKDTTTDADLFAVIGYTYGGSGASFNLPDLRGEFIRGFDNGRGIDAGRVIGSAQADELKSHNHTKVGYNNPIGGYQYPGFSGAGDGQNQVASNNTGGVETRPRNIAMMFVIKS